MIRKNLFLLSAFFLSVLPAASQPITSLPSIVRNARMSVWVNQVGFLPDAAKFCAAEGAGALPFEVIDATTNRVVYSGKMLPAGADFGKQVSGTFSEVRTPGVYYVRAGGGRSYPFRIEEGIYKEPMSLIMYYFSKQRCGGSTTGYLTPCHTEDGIRVDNGQRQDVSGGWHDASDLRKWVSATLYGMVGLLGAAEVPGLGLDEEALTEELLWGNRYFLAMQEPAGYVMDHVGGDLFAHSDSNHWSDNVPGTDDDRVIQTRPVDYTSQFTFASVEARMARYMKGKDAGYAARCLEAAVRCYDWCFANIKEYTTGITGSGLLAAIDLYKATGEAKYRDAAYKMADDLLALQVAAPKDKKSPGGFFRAAPGSDAFYSEIFCTDMAMVGLAKLLQQFPEGNNARYKAALRSYCDDYLRFVADKNACALLPYTVYGKAEPTGRQAGAYWYGYFMNPDQEWWVGINANIASKGIGLVMASRLLGDPSLKELAQRQLDWIFGANPLATATMRGIGYEHPSFSTAFYQDTERPGSEFFPPTPHIPGAVLNGIGGDAQGMPVLIDGSWQTGEYWTPMVGHTLWLMAELTAR